MEIMNAQASGASTEFKYVYGTKPLNLYVEGTFDGATVSIEAKTPLGNFVPLKDGSITQAEMVVIESFPFTGRVAISGGGVSTSISAHVVGQIVVGGA